MPATHDDDAALRVRAARAQQARCGRDRGHGVRRAWPAGRLGLAAPRRRAAVRSAARRSAVGSALGPLGRPARARLTSAAQQRPTQLPQQPRRRRRRTSPGGTGSPHSGPFSTAATNGSPCSAQVTSGAGRRRLERPRRRGVGVDEVEPLVLDARRTARSPRGDVDRVPAHVRQDRRVQPLDRAGPLAAALGDARRARRRPRTAPACRRRCRAPAGRPRAASAITGPPRTASSPAMQAANAPTPGTTRPSAPRPRPGRR